MVGLLTSARPIATRCCWPPESSDGRWVRRSVRPDLAEQLVDPLPVGLFAGDRERQQDVLLRGQHRQEIEELEDEADVPAPELRQVRVVELRDRLTCDRHLAGGRLVEPGKDVHQGRLAGARWAHDGGELAFRHVEGDAPERIDGGVTLAVAAGQVGRGDDGARSRAPHRPLLLRGPPLFRSSVLHVVAASLHRSGTADKAAHRRLDSAVNRPLRARRRPGTRARSRRRRRSAGRLPSAWHVRRGSRTRRRARLRPSRRARSA